MTLHLKFIVTKTLFLIGDKEVQNEKMGMYSMWLYT